VPERRPPQNARAAAEDDIAGELPEDIEDRKDPVLSDDVGVDEINDIGNGVGVTRTN
jgi:hypothetical protein